MLKKHRHFIKDFTSIRITDEQFNRLIEYLHLLSNGKALPSQARDHRLEGNYGDCREFHIGGDLLVIYMKRGEDTIILRIGTHSKLFGK